MRLKFTAFQTKIHSLALNFRNPRISEKANSIMHPHIFSASSNNVIFSVNLIKYNFICIALNHRYSLKGLKVPYMYDTPLILATQRARKISLD